MRVKEDIGIRVFLAESSNARRGKRMYNEIFTGANKEKGKQKV